MSSTTLAQSLMKLELIDEFWLTVHSATVGSGKALFDGWQGKMPLKLVEAKSYATRPVFLRYERIE